MKKSRFLLTFLLLLPTALPPTTYASPSPSYGFFKGFLLSLTVYLLGHETTASAQSIATWGGQGDDQANDVVPTPDKGVLLGATSSSYQLGSNTKGLLMQYESSDALAWFIAFGATHSEGVMAVAKPDATTNLATGFTTSYGDHSERIFVTAYDNDDNQWQSAQYFPTSGPSRGVTMATQGDGSYAVGAQISAGDSMKIGLLYFNPNHTLEQFIYIDSGSDDQVKAIQPLNDGGYVALGSTINSSDGSKDLLLFKMANNRMVAWSYVLSGSGDQVGFDLEIHPNGHIAITGYSKNSLSGKPNILWVVCEGQGNLLTMKILSSSSSDQGYGITHDEMNNTFITGRTYSSQSITGSNILLVKITPTENIEAYTLGSIMHDQGHAIAYHNPFITAVGDSLNPMGAGAKDILVLRTIPNTTIPCSNPWQANLVDLSPSLSFNPISLNRTLVNIVPRPIAWLTYSLTLEENILCNPTTHPTMQPTAGPILLPAVQIASTIPMQKSYVSGNFEYQIVVKELFQVPEGQTLTLTAQEVGKSSLPSGLSFDASSPAFSSQPNTMTVGSYRIALIATDQNNNVATLTFILNVLSDDPGIQKADHYGFTASIIGPLCAAFFIIVCTVYSCRQHTKNQAKQTALLRQTNAQVKILNFNKKIDVNPQNDNPRTTMPLSKLPY